LELSDILIYLFEFEIICYRYFNFFVNFIF